MRMDHKWIILLFLEADSISPTLKLFRNSVYKNEKLIRLLTNDVQNDSFYFLLGDPFYANNSFLSPLKI